MTLTFTRSLDPGSVPPASAFGFRSPAGAPPHWRVYRVSIEDKKVLLHLNGRVSPCDYDYKVTYAKPDTGALRNLWGTEADAIAAPGTAVTKTETNCDHTWMGGMRTGSVIITAKRPFATDVAPQASWFTVTASGGPVTVTAASFSADDPRELKLSLSREFTPGETVTVSYTRPPGERGLWDVDGNQLGNVANAPLDTGEAPVPARFVSAATEPQGRGLWLTFTKDIWVAGNHADYTVLVGGERRATRAASWEDNRVALVLTEPVRAGETVTVAYAKPSEGVKLHDTDELAVESFGPEAVANTLVQAANAPATGAPSIAGSAQVGETLTASTAEIADADGLTDATFAFQWVSNDGTADSDIAGATGSSYTLTEADEGRRVKVRVAFTDDAGNAETLVSAATAAVAARPLTASFVDMPAEHDGTRRFGFELRFSENFPGRFRYKVLRDHAFQVTNGRVTQAKRVAPGQNRRWRIEVKPDSLADVTMTLPAATDCALPGAVCTEAGRKLSNTVTATVQGPVALSVADARANEADEALAFTVSLSRAASATVTVDYATADGSATAGEDYTAASGTLSFAAGETEKTVSVPILDDAIDEGEETFTLKLANAQGAADRRRRGDGDDRELGSAAEDVAVALRAHGGGARGGRGLRPAGEPAHGRPGDGGRAEREPRGGG